MALLYPTLHAVAWPGATPPQFINSRASTATYINAAGKLVTAGIGVTRTDFDPATGALLGWLIEESRTNLLTYSEQFDNGAWSASDVTVTANATTAPDGKITADQLSSTGDGTVDRNLALTSGTSYTYSFWAKRSGGSDVTLQVIAADYGGPGVVLRQSFMATSSWQRFTFTWTATTTASWYLRIGAEGTFSSGESIYIWGAQLEAGAFATSYIATTSAAATRSADSITALLSSFAFNALEGTIIVEANILPGAGSGSSFVVSFDDGTLGNYVGITNTLNPALGVVTASVAQATISLGAVDMTSARKLVAAYKANDFAASMNGGTVGTDTSGTVPTVTTLYLGKHPFGAHLNGHIKQISYIPRSLSDAEIQWLAV